MFCGEVEADEGDRKSALFKTDDAEYFFFPLAYNTLLESLYAQLQAEGGRGGGGQ